MNKRILSDRTKLAITVAVAFMMFVGIVITHAYFYAASKTVKPQDISITTGNLRLIFDDEDDASVNKKLELGQSVVKNFSIENAGTEDLYAKIVWENLINTYLSQSLSYKLECNTGNGIWTKVETYRTKIQRSLSSSTKTLADRLLVPAGKKYMYRLTITLENLQDVNQIKDLDAVFTTKFSIELGTTGAVSEMIALKDAIAKLPADQQQTINNVISANNLTRIAFESSFDPKENAIGPFDLSKNRDESVIGYLLQNEDGASKYTLYIQCNGEIYTPENCANYFNIASLERIEGLEYLNTSNTTDMSYMFSGCTNLKTLDLSNFDTSKVQSMNAMFLGCSNLTSLNLTNFDTRNVKIMSSMFSGANSLSSLDLSSFNTSNVTNMTSMFLGCRSLTSLDLGNFNTSKVTIMNTMFNGCINLKSLNISNFDTRNVTNMGYMFTSCRNLTAINLSNFNTSKVTGMTGMFSDCRALTSLDLSNFNTSNVTRMDEMFQGCKALANLNLSSFNKDKVTNQNKMFDGIYQSIKIKVADDAMKNWFINVSNNPILNENNFTVL